MLHFSFNSWKIKVPTPCFSQPFKKSTCQELGETSSWLAFISRKNLTSLHHTPPPPRKAYIFPFNVKTVVHQPKRDNQSSASPYCSSFDLNCLKIIQPRADGGQLRGVCVDNSGICFRKLFWAEGTWATDLISKHLINTTWQTEGKCK